MLTLFNCLSIPTSAYCSLCISFSLANSSFSRFNSCTCFSKSLSCLRKTSPICTNVSASFSFFSSSLLILRDIPELTLKYQKYFFLKHAKNTASNNEYTFLLMSVSPPQEILFPFPILVPVSLELEFSPCFLFHPVYIFHSISLCIGVLCNKWCWIRNPNIR